MGWRAPQATGEQLSAKCKSTTSGASGGHKARVRKGGRVGGALQHLHQGADDGTRSRKLETVRFSHVRACKGPSPHHASSPLSVPLHTERHVASQVIQPGNLKQSITSMKLFSTGQVVKVAEGNFDGLVRLRSLDQPQCRLHQLAALLGIIPFWQNRAHTHETYRELMRWWETPSTRRTELCR